MRVKFFGQRGFTLLEMLIAAAISVIVCGGAALGINQLLLSDKISSNEQIAISQIQTGVDDISRDVLQSQTITVNGTTLTLAVYTGISNNTPVVTTVTYTINGGALLRNSTNLIPAATASFNWNQTTSVFTFTLAATAGSGKSAYTETRTTQINVRAP
jgi:prepilin-type N-terminal cleavage/methylation domain-containing protein